MKTLSTRSRAVHSAEVHGSVCPTLTWRSDAVVRRGRLSGLISLFSSDSYTAIGCRCSFAQPYALDVLITASDSYTAIGCHCSSGVTDRVGGFMPVRLLHGVRMPLFEASRNVLKIALFLSDPLWRSATVVRHARCRHTRRAHRSPTLTRRSATVVGWRSRARDGTSHRVRSFMAIGCRC